MSQIDYHFLGMQKRLRNQQLTRGKSNHCTHYGNKEELPLGECSILWKCLSECFGDVVTDPESGPSDIHHTWKVMDTNVY